MAKDPFANLPQIDPKDHVDNNEGVQPDHVDDVDDVSAGSPPRNLMKAATKWGMPIMGLAVVIWLFLPDEPSTMRKKAEAPATVDTQRQVSETLAMVEDLKKEAAKRPPVTVPVMPGTPQTQPGAANAGTSTTSIAATNPAYQSATYNPPLPPTHASGARNATSVPTPEMEQKRQAAYEAAIARQEEIRASAINVAGVRLLPESERSDSSVPPVLADVQAQIGADVDRENALRAQREMQEQLITAMAPKEQARSKGASEDFLAANTAAANSQPNLTRQMAPQAATLVNEGHVIRTVLLTNLSSDLPGRVIARVTSNVYDSKQRHIVIPKGSQLIGVYSSQVAVGQERMLLAMNRLILPNGNWISLSGAGATDPMGMAGIKADVNNHFMKMFGSSLVLGATSLLLPRADTTINTVPGIGQNGASGTAGSIFATSLNEVVKTLMERNKSIPPTLSLQAGQEFIFMVAQDMAMVPYQP